MTTLVKAAGAPVGSILAFGGNSSNIPEGFLLCNGALLNRNDYAELFAALGTHWGTTSGTNFRIPTTQGLVLRGTAYGSGYDPDRNSRTAIQSGAQAGDQVGSYQSNRNKSHRHSDGSHTHGGPNHRHVSGGKVSTTSGNYHGYGHYSFPYGTGGLGVSDPVANLGHSPYTNYVSGTTGGSGTLYTNYDGGNQSAPNNVYVNYIIKY